MADNFIWLRGEIVRQSQAFVNVLSPVAQFGLNVFEGIRCYWNAEEGVLYAFRLRDHLHRLLQSSRIVSFESPYSVAEIESSFRHAIEANDFLCDTAVRLTLFGDGQGSWSSCEPISMFIAPMPKARTDLRKIPKFAACVSSWERINDNVLPPRAKVGANYINGRFAHLQARRDGYDLPIFLGADRKVAEGAGACLFMVRSGEMITPPTTSSVLDSITRDTVIRMARDIGIGVRERTIDRTELYLADEIFLCGSAAEISPIVSIDRFEVGRGEPGPLTVDMLRRYLAVASGVDGRYPDWRTAVNRAKTDSRSQSEPEASGL